jgi:hypothetical protein
MENRPVGTEFTQAEAEGGTDMTDTIGAFGEYANAPKTRDNFRSISFLDFIIIIIMKVTNKMQLYTLIYYS